jgi:hypothetical protein
MKTLQISWGEISLLALILHKYQLTCPPKRVVEENSSNFVEK